MKIIYIDSDFKCHTTNETDAYISIKTDFFDGKCDTYIEGYRFVPEGENWTRSDGEVFHGEMIAPWVDYSELDAAQREYEQSLLKQYEAELAELDAVLLDMQYLNLVEGL